LQRIQQAIPITPREGKTTPRGEPPKRKNKDDTSPTVPRESLKDKDENNAKKKPKQVSPSSPVVNRLVRTWHSTHDFIHDDGSDHSPYDEPEEYFRGPPREEMVMLDDGKSKIKKIPAKRDEPQLSPPKRLDEEHSESGETEEEEESEDDEKDRKTE